MPNHRWDEHCILCFASFPCASFIAWFCLQAAPEPTPAVPVPDVAAVITVDEQALGGGVSMMADFVALFGGVYDACHSCLWPGW